MSFLDQLKGLSPEELSDILYENRQAIVELVEAVEEFTHVHCYRCKGCYLCNALKNLQGDV